MTTATTYKSLKDGFNTFIKSTLSVYGICKNSPNGHKTDYILSLNLAINIQTADFEDGGKFYNIPLEKFPDSLKNVSTTESFAGDSLLHVAISYSKPRGLQFVLDIARERGELETALITVNDDNKTPRESLENAIKTYDYNIEKLSDLEGMRRYRDNLEKCLNVLTNTENHLVYKSKWQKKSNTAKLLA